MADVARQSTLPKSMWNSGWSGKTGELEVRARNRGCRGFRASAMDCCVTSDADRWTVITGAVYGCPRALRWVNAALGERGMPRLEGDDDPSRLSRWTVGPRRRAD